MNVQIHQSKDKSSQWIRTQDPTICIVQETHFKCKGSDRLKGKRWSNIYHPNTYQRNVKHKY